MLANAPVRLVMLTNVRHYLGARAALTLALDSATAMADKIDPEWLQVQSKTGDDHQFEVSAAAASKLSRRDRQCLEQISTAVELASFAGAMTDPPKRPFSAAYEASANAFIAAITHTAVTATQGIGQLEVTPIVSFAVTEFESSLDCYLRAEAKRRRRPRRRSVGAKPPSARGLRRRMLSAAAVVSELLAQWANLEGRA
jgi:hypothetical protein